MTLTALLLGMLSAGVYSVVNDWQDETSVLDDSIDQALILLQLERALTAAFPHSYIHPERLARYVYFTGTANELRFVSTVSPQRHIGLTGWNLISSAEDGLQLKLTPAYSDNPDVRFEELEPVSLLPDYTARFRYLIQRDLDEKLWLEEWPAEEMQSLPLAVEIVLTPRDSKNTGVLHVLAPIRANTHENIEPVQPVL